MAKGFTLWFAGLSGSGKSTLAEQVRDILLERGMKVEVLDGDVVRQNLSKGLGFSKEDRFEHNLRVARLAITLSPQIPVIVAVIAPMKRARIEISRICAPTWVYLKRTMPERDGHFYEEPVGLFTINHDETSAEYSAQLVEDYWLDT